MTRASLPRALRAAPLAWILAAACASEPAPRAPAPAAPSRPLVPARSAPAWSADEAAAVKALRACFEAKDADAREEALAALDKLAVPKDASVRARMLRDALAKPPRAGASRFGEELGEPQLLALTGTPTDYDSSQVYPTVLSLSAYCHDAHWSLQVFSVPPDEVAYIKSETPEGALVQIPTPRIPWEDGLVLAPSLPLTGDNKESFGAARTRVLSILARANREYGVDPDRLVAAGLSMGGALAYDIVSRHPDRFAGMACVSGGCPQQPTPLDNLKTLAVYVMHGDKDPDVDLSVAKENVETLGKKGVPCTLDVIEGGGHHWPLHAEEGERVRSWLRAQKRDAWPKALELIVAASTEDETNDTRRRIYWLELPPNPRNRGAQASVQDNVITLGPCIGFQSLTLFLGEPLVDLDRELVVKQGERELFRGKLARSFRALVRDLETDGWDTTRAAPARLEVTLGP